MRVIDAESGPGSARLDGGMPPSDRTMNTSSTLSNAPTTRSGRRRRWSHVVLVVELSAIALLASASAGHADTMVVALAGSVTDVLNNVRNWIMGILAGLATVFLSIGGVRYVMGGGDPGEVEKAKTAFKSAGWGYGLAALAPLVVEILKGIVGA
jgi:hypothetical protein